MTSGVLNVTIYYIKEEGQKRPDGKNMKITKKFIQEEARRLDAIDITSDSFIVPNSSTIYISYGVYGMNGALLQNRENKKYYVINSRSTNLFRNV